MSRVSKLKKFGQLNLYKTRIFVTSVAAAAAKCGDRSESSNEEKLTFTIATITKIVTR